MHSRSGAEQGGHNNRHLLTYLLTYLHIEIYGLGLGRQSHRTIVSVDSRTIGRQSFLPIVSDRQFSDSVIVLPSYCDALTDRWQPVIPASGRPTVMQRNLNTAPPVTVLCVGWSVGCSSWEVGRGVVPEWDTLTQVPSETIGALSHRPIVLTDTINYRTIGFSHNRPNPNMDSTRIAYCANQVTRTVTFLQVKGQAYKVTYFILNLQSQSDNQVKLLTVNNCNYSRKLTTEHGQYPVNIYSACPL